MEPRLVYDGRARPALFTLILREGEGGQEVLEREDAYTQGQGQERERAEEELRAVRVFLFSFLLAHLRQHLLCQHPVVGQHLRQHLRDVISESDAERERQRDRGASAVARVPYVGLSLPGDALSLPAYALDALLTKRRHDGRGKTEHSERAEEEEGRRRNARASRRSSRACRVWGAGGAFRLLPFRLLR
ncbi:hypothetical protein NLJ89_g11863 [Agrocybe chaxingu]|uniref:Uncharacterized protein n=1 Tax=Agrocybe chaxingu TaxID=84603 RepID=A0A9W8MMN3_9AGAR|nr:hypothetical protein NLJ89_g11863 [Agrocybe chaxingu]